MTEISREAKELAIQMSSKLQLARDTAQDYLNLKAGMTQIYQIAIAHGWFHEAKTLSSYRVYEIAKSHQSAEDFLVTEARKLAADGGWNADGQDMPMVKFALRALKRGLEMAKETPDA